MSTNVPPAELPPTAAPAPPPPPPFRVTLTKVIAVQVISLLALWLLQLHFTR